MTETPATKPEGFTVERTGERQYSAKNERGSELVIGYGLGEFSPGDLLKLAILGCNALSSEARFARGLGEDFEITGSITADYLKEEDHNEKAPHHAADHSSHNTGDYHQRNHR